jgi:hypothetical protein
MMTSQRIDVSRSQTPLADLEQSLIAEYLRARGYDAQRLAVLPDAERHRLLKDASVHASGKLTEVESRAHFVHAIHDGAASGARE